MPVRRFARRGVPGVSHNFFTFIAMKKLLTLLLGWFAFVALALGQRVVGRVVDAETGAPIPFVNLFYKGTQVATQSDVEGRFNMAYRQGQLFASSVGYVSRSVRPTAGGDSLIIVLKSADLGFGEATVKAKRTKYSRKDNPAVEFMRKVIAAKKGSDLKRHDYYTLQQYSKLNFAVSDVTPRVLEDGQFKRMPFLKDHVEISPETGKLILPLTVDETVTQQLWRKSDQTRKNIVIGQRSEGINDLINTGDVLNAMMKDVFTDVNLYDNNIRLLQYQIGRASCRERV